MKSNSTATGCMPGWTGAPTGSSDLAGGGYVGAGMRNSQDPSAGRCLGADLRLCPGGRLERVRIVAVQMAHNPGTGLDPRAVVPERR
jgi:hypothetical protein